jgi:polysaccharide biosynthesis protein PelA
VPKQHSTGGKDRLGSITKQGNRYLRWLLVGGDTTPFEAAVKKTREAGVRNINGGDSRLDLEFPSVAHVPPISAPVGSERQIYAVNSNENTYTNDWTGPHFGFMNLSHTLAATEYPRRLKPANIYYHMYSGERPSSLQAVKYHLEWARRVHVIPIPASQYAAIAEGFFSTKIMEVARDRWMILDRGELQTVRFDGAEAVMLDLASSSGVLGQARLGDALYVALDPAVENPVVALQPVGTEPAPTDHPYLIDSRWQIWDLKRTSCGFTFRASGFGLGDMSWHGLEQGPYRISALHEGELVWDTTISPQNGKMSISIPATGYAPIELTFACTDATQ